MQKTLSLCLFLLLGTLYAQKNFSIEEAIIKGRTTLAPKKLRQLNFTKTPGQVYYINENNNKQTLTTVDKDGKEQKIVDLVEINNQIKKTEGKELSAFPFVEWETTTTFKFLSGNTYFVYDIKNKSLQKTDQKSVDMSKENAELSPDGKTVVYTNENNLYITKNDNVKQITSDGSNDIVYGQAVHRSEFGIEKGIFFSPKGNLFAFYRMDQSMVTDYPIINWSVKPAKNTNIKYPFAGDKSHQVTVGIYNCNTNTTIYVKTVGDPEQYLTNLAWNNDETKLYIAIVNRAQNHMWLNEYNASTGEFIKTLFEEQDEKFIEPLTPLQVVKNNPNQFIWQSNRDGYNHIYLYEFSGKLIKQLTSGNWEVKQTIAFDQTGQNLFFYANISSPVNQDLGCVNLKSGKTKKITTENGFHTVIIDPAGNFVIDNYSNITTPRNVNVIEVKKQKSHQIFSAPNPVSDYNLGQLKLFTIKNNQNQDLYCRMFLPVNFDSTKKYPVVVYLYNGPHSQLVTNTWLAGADLWYHYMAQNGFIVFTLDGRGTNNRGKLFQQAIHRQLGTVEMEDQLSGVEYLKKLKYVDADRMGVHGWSFGGFMTTSLMTRYPNTFKVAVAGGPVIDWSYYEIMYTERYMDSPQENIEGYETNNLLNNIQNLKGKLLVIHGTDDDVVVWQHSLKLLQKSVEKNVQLDYYVYPGHKHNVIGKDRAHLMQKISNYFIENL